MRTPAPVAVISREEIVDVLDGAAAMKHPAILHKRATTMYSKQAYALIALTSLSSFETAAATQDPTWGIIGKLP